MSLVDMHIHLKSRSPCSNLSIEELFNNLSPKIDAICITDHGILTPINDLPFQNILVFFGVEITTDLGDLLAYGLELLPERKLNASDTIEFIHTQGGIAVCAHPFSDWHIAFGDNVYDYEFDAIEINGAMNKHQNQQAKRAAAIMDLPTVGGSDAHSFGRLNTICTLFHQGINSMVDIINAIKSKQCKAVQV